MLCIAKIASCRTLSPAAVQLRKLVAAGEIPDTPVCAALWAFIFHFFLQSPLDDWYLLLYN